MAPGYTERYSLKIPPLVDASGRAVAEQPAWMTERTILKHYDELNAKFPGKLLPRHEHFKKFCAYIWSRETARFPLELNPNFCKILERHQEHQYLAIAGCASSGKSEAIAAIGIAEYLVAPELSKILYTSTDAKSAKGKIWGAVVSLWLEAERFYEEWEERFKQIGIVGSCFIPGRLIASECVIRGWDGKNINPKRGIELIAAEVSKAKEASDKLQGTKAERLFLYADEMATITPAVLTTACSNFRMNPMFKMAATFNPDGHYDPAGVMSKPTAGWSSITAESEEWESTIEPFGIKGWVIRFDGLKSPNVLAGRKLWKGLLDLEQLNSFQASLGGEKSKSFWQMVRGWWSPTGSLDSIYTEAEILKYRADAPVTTWLETPEIIAGLDPSWTHSGDRAVLVIAKVGRARNIDTGEDQKVFERIETLVLDEDVTEKQTDKSEWIVRLVKQKMQQYGIKVGNLAIDSTGGGASFSSLLRRDIGTGFMDVIFNATASDEKYSSSDKRTGKERFVNVMSELWYVGRELIRSGQIKNLDPDTVLELCARSYEERAGKVIVEPKAKMKLRTKKSPDRADALLITLHLARLRHNLTSTERAAPRHTPTTPALPPQQRQLQAELAALPQWQPQKRRATLNDLAASVGNWAGAGWGDSY